MDADRAPRTVAILAPVMGVVSGLWSALATLMVVTFASLTYYLPPPPGSTEATEHHDWSVPTLLLAPLSVVGMVLAVVACVVGVRGLVRGWWCVAG
ncbi:hypothetical protein H3H54_14185 [Brachybacterium sp. Z12]|uniref:hypothetical protein n=1 Tax=Brachybacterium sp. Z12 TaxID=2759167 RepID=UPI0018602EE9|nr:hypothetical protein [Brachybacterium sp. Z12]QNN82229.1 hypothetical protein H3H54_14185 [Brachybacterium sp. Z12]